MSYCHLELLSLSDVGCNLKLEIIVLNDNEAIYAINSFPSLTLRNMFIAQIFARTFTCHRWPIDSDTQTKQATPRVSTVTTLVTSDVLKMVDQKCRIVI